MMAGVLGMLSNCIASMQQLPLNVMVIGSTHWFTFNEPIVIQTRCYLDAIRWPHEQNTKKWMQWNYHKTLASALAIKTYHEKRLSRQNRLRIES